MRSPADHSAGDVLRLDPAWRRSPEVVRIFAALGAPAVDVRAVGGCVRDAVLARDQTTVEIDIGTPEPPDAVIARLKAAGLRVLPTGLAHGTVTATVDGRTFEITSLRRDTACDGRHAAVEFTTDWHEDARRRDFTFNAMSMQPDGTVHDDHGGTADARAGRIRFVGDPADRIREDYLRILRLFRFAALYARAPIDAATLQACAAHVDGLARLSGERIQAELAKLLSAPDPHPALMQMRACGVLAALAPLRDDGHVLCQTLAAEAATGLNDRDWLRRLAAVIAPTATDAVADRLKLSNADRARLKGLCAVDPVLTPGSSTLAIDSALFAHGATLIRDRVLLAWAMQPDLDRPIPRTVWLALLERTSTWVHHPLPIGGDDILRLGIAPGRAVGELLAAMTAWWVAGGFRASRDQVLSELRRRTGNV